MRRYHDAFDYDGSDRNYDSTAIRLRYDYDVLRAPTSIRREQKMNTSIFRRSRVVVVPQSNRNCDLDFRFNQCESAGYGLAVNRLALSRTGGVG